MFIKFFVLTSIMVNHTKVAHAEPIAVKPLEPILEDTRVVGYTSTDPITEFGAPDHWTLKNGGAIKRHLEDGQCELILQVAPTYRFSDQRKSQLQQRGVFKVFLPLPFNLKEANLYVPPVLGDLKAEFVPYPGNGQSEFYFRIALNMDQMNTLFKLSRTGQSLLGEVHLTLEIGGRQEDSTVPIAISLPPTFLNPSFRPGRHMVRWLPSDDGRGGGFSGNGLCDGDESCVYQDLHTGRLWRIDPKD